MRFSSVVMAYFIIGAVMWGGGVIGWGDTGVAGVLIEDPESGDVNEETAEEIEQLGGPIEQLLDSVAGGGLVAVWIFLKNLIGFMFWPIDTLYRVNAPIEAVVLLGGGVTMAFYASLLRIIRGTA